MNHWIILLIQQEQMYPRVDVAVICFFKIKYFKFLYELADLTKNHNNGNKSFHKRFFELF